MFEDIRFSLVIEKWQTRKYAFRYATSCEQSIWMNHPSMIYICFWFSLINNHWDIVQILLIINHYNTRYFRYKNALFGLLSHLIVAWGVSFLTENCLVIRKIKNSCSYQPDSHGNITESDPCTALIIVALRTEMTHVSHSIPNKLL